jgi:glycosyltransferase involved in cell wall biosynthesis
MSESTRPAGIPSLVSVVIPCYNQAHFLAEAIESVLSQSYPHFAVIVVDDGSPDDTSEVASRYEEVRLIRQENRGLSGARNTGIRHSEEEYVVFLDADDRLLPEALEVGVRELERRPQCALVAGNHRLIGADGLPLGEEPQLAGSLRRTPPSRNIGEDIYLTILSRRFHILPGTVMYRRFAFEKVGTFDPQIEASEDYDLYFRVARRFPVYCHDTVVLEARRHGENMTRDHGRMLKATLDVLRSQSGYIRSNERYLAAYKAGVRKVHEEHGLPLASAVRSGVRKLEWKEALRGMHLLARYYPRGLLLLVNRRPLLERQLRDYDKQLREKQRRLKELGGALLVERRQLQNRTQQVKRLRRRNRQLEERERELQRRLQEIETSRLWQTLKRIGRWRRGIVKR